MAQLNPITCLLAFLVTLLSSPLLLVNAAPSPPSSLNSRDDAGQGRQQLPPVWPTPQEISRTDSCSVSLKGDVTIVTGDATDAATIDVIKAIVSSAGGSVTVSSDPSDHGTQILIGTGDQHSAAAAAAKALAGDSAQDLEADGYVLAAGKYESHPTIVLNGVDTRGTFYASQTLRQLAAGRRGVPGVKVRDWPLMPIRGSIEGFYGTPWSHQARLDQYVFYGKHKMNTYIYTPKSDPLLRDEWRSLYNESALAQLQELVDTANANHVDFTFALSPGLDLCYSSDDDFNTTITKFDQIRNLGVSSFYIPLDDIPHEFHCDSDKEKWPGSDDKDDISWLAAAQAYYLNRVQHDYIEAHNLNDLQTVPTNYAGSQPDPYKTRFGTDLDKKVRIQWTGEGVFSPQVTVESVVRADSTYVTDTLYFWDNFPVNDGKPHRLFLNPLTGREPDLYEHLLGFTSNPMVQSYASMPALANYGDYTWNSLAYDADGSMEAALWELAGSDDHVHDAVVAFSDLNQNWPYRDVTVNAPQLNADIDAFWAARNGSSSDGAKALSARLELIAALPDVLPNMAMERFAPDVEPWSTVAMQWATASQHLISMLDALDAGDKSKASSEFDAAQEWVEKTKAKTVSGRNNQAGTGPVAPTTGDGAFDSFLGNATAVYKSS